MRKDILLYTIAAFLTCGAYAQNNRYTVAENHGHETDPDLIFAINNYSKYWNQARAGDDRDKSEALDRLRTHFREHPRKIKWKKDAVTDPMRLLELLTDQGTFTDLDRLENEWRAGGSLYDSEFSNTPDDEVGIFIADALQRIYLITAHFCADGNERDIPAKVFRAILHYGRIEFCRSNDKPRFHASCFAIPSAAANIYFSMLQVMDDAENGKYPVAEDGCTDCREAACETLKALALQSWTQPLRKDATDTNVVSVERFRNHVWWVGGNALAYRPLLQTAAMFSSIPMVDVLAEICRKCISNTSQTTYDEAFWTEGFTADGAGWGHGMQCLIWGYPIDGTSNALNMMQTLDGTPWECGLDGENTEALMNFFRGGSWYWYKGWRLPGLDRKSYKAELAPYPIAYRKMLDKIIDSRSSSFTDGNLAELRQLSYEAGKLDIRMERYAPGDYSGMRWFFNNDDFMKKTADCHISINMASFRCDGLESAPQADKYNFTCTDGATLLQRDGDEYFKIMGAWDVTAYPGVTAREGMDRLTPVTNWRGYCSKYNFAAASHDKNARGVAGLIFDKMDANMKKSPESIGKKSGRNVANAVLYGIKAHKSWFFIDNYMVALGAGITDSSEPPASGTVRTTIDQTALEGKVTMTYGRHLKNLSHGITAIPVSDSPVWITHEGKFSYCLIPSVSRNAYVSLERRPADWVKMNRENKANLDKLPEEAEILRIWTEHGVRPVNGSYGYAVWTGNGDIPKKERKRLPFEIVRNDTGIQAIEAFDGRLVQAVFYPEDDEYLKYRTFYRKDGKPASVPDCTSTLETRKYRISVSAPCTLMLDSTGEDTMLFVTDALMDAGLEEIAVTVNGKSYSIPLPQGKHCGDVASFRL